MFADLHALQSTTFPRPTRSANPAVVAKPHVNAAASPNQTFSSSTSVSATVAVAVAVEIIVKELTS